MSDCVVVQPIAEAGINRLREAGLTVHVAKEPRLKELRPHISTARAVITRNHGFSAAEIDASPHLAVIASHGTGMDAIDTEAAARRGIVVVSTPGANTQAVAEHTLALILACAKAIPAADRAVRAGDFAMRYRQTTVELAGRSLGLVGYGRIARRVAQFASAVGMQVSAISRHSEPEEMVRDGVCPAVDLDTLCARSDIISLHTLPLDGALFDAARLARLKPGAILINTARGALIDEDALVAALQSGRLAAAALDVFRAEPLPPDSPLMTCPRLLLTPHIGGAAIEAMDRTALAVAGKVIEVLVGTGVASV